MTSDKKEPAANDQVATDDKKQEPKVIDKYFGKSSSLINKPGFRAKKEPRPA